MTYSETAAHGAQIKIGDAASPEVFTAIKGIKSGPNGPNSSRRVIESVHHDTDYVHKKIGVKDYGQVTFVIDFDSTDTQHLALQTAFTAGTRKNFQEILNDAGDQQYAYSAYVTDFTPTANPDGMNEMNVALLIATEPVIS